MILPLSAIWGGAPFDPLAGNAQVFDGSFDYDTINFATSGIRTDIDYTFFSSFNISTLNTNTIIPLFASDSGGVTSIFQIDLVKSGATYRLRLVYVSDSSVRIWQSGQVIDSGVITRVGIAYDGLFSGGSVVMNINDTLENVSFITVGALLNFTPVSANRIGGQRASTQVRYFNGDMKTLQFVNNDMSGSADFASSVLAGSAQGIIPNANFLLNVDFDKVNGENPTTFADTPTYTITGVGGTTYAPYL